jgi:exopolyphosphatase / guanosine-5'-triphosphate,3'-diphosphate pyrophosphatase
MPLLASIDVGSNTLRLLVAEVRDKKIIDVYSDRKITRLGNKVGQTGRLQDENMDASLSALMEFSSVISKYGVVRTKAVATSALREASNSDIFIKKAFDSAGIAIEVISGRKEAEMTLAGILASFHSSEFRIHHSAFIIDIGGGSSEWILYRDKDNLDMGSIPIGVIKLAQKHIKTDPVSEEDLNALNHEIISVLTNLKYRIGQYIDSNTKLIGTAGTFTTIASIDLGLEAYARGKVHLHKINYARLKAMIKNLMLLTLKERVKIRGLEPGRADLIIPGIQFTINVMDIFGFDELTINDYGLLEGTLLAIKDSDGKSISETAKP